MAEVDKKHTQQIYYFDQATFEEQTQCQEVLYDYNHSRPSEVDRRAALLKDIFAEVGEDCMIEPPLHANWGKHTHLGNKVYANFNLTLVDDTHIYIGDYTMIGPNVTLATAGHPISPEPRKQAAQFNVAIHIASNVWIGANSVVLPGISIGENSVIGAGSVVTKDIPANVVAVGNPCKVLREISEHDKQFYYKDLAFD
ncbi:sugar O-acetyltransferase [Agarivorans aestuarii]|uniref:Acetyltransferase n=1 Tax=Agarivorans aestuarii TaxID=1563703 RepID=A0ABU7G339_9ALTE|nr:sugar O-acetyltransferase [Agarivorans aestuarii]MEE1673763.1 sugar O-acetyltransferase [Agarivorans aestuarii]